MTIILSKDEINKKKCNIYFFLKFAVLLIKHMKNYTFLIAAGGTGGHLFPAISVVSELKKMNPNYNFIFVGRKDKIEGKVVKTSGYEFHHIEIDGLRGLFDLRNLLLPLKVLQSEYRIKRIIKKKKVDALIATGAYISFPPALAANNAKVPIFLMESNFNPGKTITLLSKYAEILFTSFPETQKFLTNKKIKRIEYTGNPVREDFFKNQIDKAKAREIWALEPDKPTLLVFGGSLGAQKINNAIKLNLDELSNANLQMIWQTGKEYEKYKSLDLPKQFKCVEFIDDMYSAYSAADLVLCRSGASTLAELAVMAKPSLLVPLVLAANNEQEFNARFFERNGAAVVLNQETLQINLTQKICEVLNNKSKLREMEINIRRFARPNAARDIANAIVANLDSRV